MCTRGDPTPSVAVLSAPIDKLTAALDTTGLTQVELAERISVTPQAVHNWFARGVVPAGRCLAIENATDGAVTRFELRPDVFGQPPHAAIDEAA